MQHLHQPNPARLLAATKLTLSVLDDLSTRTPESLSPAEADFIACLTDLVGDLSLIHLLACHEMGQKSVSALRIGGA